MTTHLPRIIHLAATSDDWVTKHYAQPLVCAFRARRKHAAWIAGPCVLENHPRLLNYEVLIWAESPAMAYDRPEQDLVPGEVLASSAHPPKRRDPLEIERLWAFMAPYHDARSITALVNTTRLPDRWAHRCLPNLVGPTQLTPLLVKTDLVDQVLLLADRLEALEAAAGLEQAMHQPTSGPHRPRL